MKSHALRVGFIGYGAISQDVAHLVFERATADICLVGALVLHADAPRPAKSPKIVTTLSALLAEQPEVVVEAAGHAGLREHGPAVLRAGTDLFLVSAGALAEPDLAQELLDAAQAGGGQARIVSGGVGALDALAAASIGGLTRVVHTVRKPPATVLSSEETARLTTAHEIFRGSAREAVLRFPEFLNVAAAVALASQEFDRTEVCVMADPAAHFNQHEIRAEGAFGTLRLEIENRPIPHAGRGSRLVAMSIVHALLQRRASLLIG